MRKASLQYDEEERIRIEELAEYIIRTGATIRKTAKAFGISKSYVHYNIQQKLKSQNIKLYKKARKVIEKNKAERAIRGGMATRAKYLDKKLNEL